MGTVSSLAHLTSQSCPVALAVFLLSSAIMPSQPLTLVRQFVFHALSQGCLTDMSTNSNGLFAFLAWPTRKSREVLSSTAKLTKIRFFVAMPSLQLGC